MMSLLDRVKKVKSKNFMEAVAAGSAMVAFADGLVRPEEVDKLLEYVRMDENLRVFDSLEVMETFEKYIQQFEFDFQIGKEKALKTIRRIDRNTEEARLLILVCCAIGSADGDFGNNQRLVVREMCRIMGVDHRHFDLNLRAPSPEDFPKGRESRPRGVLPNNIPEWMKNPPRLHSPSKKEDNLPDWMRNPPRLPEPSNQKKKLPEWMKNPPEMQKHAEKKDSMPDWMRNPPRLPEPSNQKKKLPEWMKNPPEMQKHAEKKDSLPEWMRNPPRLPEPSNQKEKLPDWMKNPPEMQKHAEKKDNLPEWMKNPPNLQPRTKKQDNLPEWMRNPPASSGSKMKK
ncbi:MAG: tellurite resistance TerB family protein [Desulfococcaceae bacterium]